MGVWNILDKYDTDKDILSQILKNRGIVDKKDQEIFLNPPSFSTWFTKLPKEFLSSIKKAKALINEYIEKQKIIIIHGDYDVDGICSSYILFYTIKNILKYDNVKVFIPNRFDHGYGLSENSINFLKEKYLTGLDENDCLFITVDSGITSIDEVQKLKNFGYKVIITDHHQKPQVLPPADAIVWNDQIVGTTVSWLLSLSLGLKDEKFISYCALATVCDLQPILNFNRSIVKKGLEIINSKPPLAFKSILEIAGKQKNEFDTYDLGFVIGPRLNATGRVEDASKSLDLLLSEDEETTKKIAWELNQINSSRQDKTTQMYELAQNYDGVEKLPDVIISHHEDYHEGIIGLVASMLVQKYNRPSIVISISDELAKGSVRSIPGVNIIEMLRKLDDDMFLSLGGHPMAAGFSIKKENIDMFSKKFLKLAKNELKDHRFEKIIDIDIEIEMKDLTIKTLQQLENLKPYGLGNNQPVFCSRKLGISFLNFVGSQGKHLSMKLYDGENFYKAIYFNALDLNLGLNQKDFVDVVYTAKLNTFNNKTQVEFILKDLKKI